MPTVVAHFSLKVSKAICSKDPHFYLNVSHCSINVAEVAEVKKKWHTEFPELIS